MSARPIRKQRWYPHAPEKVWVALTDPRALAEWLMPNDFQPRVGHKFRFQVDPMPGCGHLNLCEVLEVDLPRKLVYSWLPAEGAGAARPDSKPATVTWVLESENGGTRLTLVHDGLDVHPWWQRFMLRFGWGTMMKRMIPKVAGNVADDGTFTPGAFPLEKRCYKCSTIPAHLIR